MIHEEEDILNAFLDLKAYLIVFIYYYEFHKIKPFSYNDVDNDTLSKRILFQTCIHNQEKINDLEISDLTIFSELIFFEKQYFDIIQKNKNILIEEKNYFLSYLNYIQKLIISIFPNLVNLTILYILLEKANKTNNTIIIENTLLDIENIINTIF